MTTIFEPLKPIADRIYLYKPSPEAKIVPDPDPTAPSLVTLCTWVGGATSRRINKYIVKYRELYPNTAILLITTDFSNTALRPFAWIRASLEPARNVIRQITREVEIEIGNKQDHDLTTTATGNTQRGILLHLFSHGGGNTALQLALSLKEEEENQGIPNPFANLNLSLILDCCPGDDGFSRAYAAARTSVPETPVSQFLGNTLLYPTVAVINALQHARLMRAIRDLREQLNDTSIFGAGTRRLYMYSKEDAMVQWEDVESHIGDAKAKGYEVDSAYFEHGTHCGLIMEETNRGRYWGMVRGFWKGEDIVSDLALDEGDCGDIRSRL
ncbi:hypothetical protein N7478_003875 [Penicillium angulare]|uniref:uncharacterized protein n=1 Tax=Penicillium angulare TaxID=116970 RepID=UPI002541DFD4|nr:uncharacterized protein N7478_003875 [Penicillium angulare]KAJ5288189.1 hypothetical protein N7478_003875 [Penicillium angulare]